MKIPLLADKSCSIARSYGVLKEEDGIPFRGLFIIDRNQNLRQITINDLPVGRSVDETLRLVQAFMFTDEHGEGKLFFFVIGSFIYDFFVIAVCPAGWKPGSKTMKPDVAGSKDYFKDVQ